MTEYLLTELTKSPEFRLPTDYSLSIKPLSTKSLTLISLLLPLSVPLSLPSTINFCIPFVSSYNISCLYLDLKRKVSSRFFIFKLLSIDKMEPSLKQGGKEKVTLTELVFSKDFLKDLSSISIPIYSKIIISYLGSSGVPYFERSNIINFLDSYSHIFTDYKVDKQEKIKQLS